MPALDAWVNEHGGVKGFAGGQPFDNTEIITWDADVRIPAALEEAITKDNAAAVKASLVVEGVNSELDRVMSKAYIAVHEVAEEFDIDMRTAAFVLAIRRVGRAATSRIHLQTDLSF